MLQLWQGTPTPPPPGPFPLHGFSTAHGFGEPCGDTPQLRATALSQQNCHVQRQGWLHELGLSHPHHEQGAGWCWQRGQDTGAAAAWPRSVTQGKERAASLRDSVSSPRSVAALCSLLHYCQTKSPQASQWGEQRAAPCSRCPLVPSPQLPASRGGITLLTLPPGSASTRRSSSTGPWREVLPVYPDLLVWPLCVPPRAAAHWPGPARGLNSSLD